MESRERAETAAGATASTPAAAAAAAAEPDALAQGGRRGPVSRPEATEAQKIEFSCLMNAGYHASREAFLDNVHRWFMFALVVLGAGALIDVAKDMAPLLQVGAIAGAAIAALDLTFDLSNRARTHALMKRRYFELLADFVEGKRSGVEVRACINRYSAEEEPAYHALIIAQWNATQVAVFGSEAQKSPLSAWYRVTKNLLRHPTLSPYHVT